MDITMGQDKSPLHEHGLKNKLEGIQTLKRELMARFALLSHAKSLDPNVELLLDIRRTNQAIEQATQKVRELDDSEEESAWLEKIRALEDRRFQLLSQMNGNRLADYNTLSPRY